MKTPLITEIQRFALQDGPGIRSTIFLKGCPLHCPWCHNPETINPKPEIYFHANKCTACGQCVKSCPSGSLSVAQTPEQSSVVKAVLRFDRRKCTLCFKCVDICRNGAMETVGKPMDIDSIVREAVADNIFYKHSGGGVTISGGEPLHFPEFTLELSRILKTKEQVHVAIETSCFANWDRIEPLIEFIDLFMIDIKTLDHEKHRYVIGGSLQRILDNIGKLISLKADVRIHLPIIPGFNDSASDIDAYVKYLGQFVDKLSGVDILPFHSYAMGKYSQLGRNYQYGGINDLRSVQLTTLVESLRQVGLRQISVGGIIGTATSSRCS